ncbi:MAG: type II toxin-antitoxin system RelE/ParE family toxin [Rhodothermales bacterium]
MIQSFRHKGLKRLFEEDDRSRVNQEHVARLRRILTQLEFAQRIEDMNAPGWGLHALKGDLKGFWAVKVSGNWRVTFRFDEGHAWDVDYIDYH